MPWDTNLEPGVPAYEFASSQSTNLRAVAGPGTGKSFALRRRVARLLEEGADPRRILAVTFTRTAAADLRAEIGSLDVDGVDRVVAKTLHSLCYGILNRREIFEATGRQPRPLLVHEIKPLLYDLSNPDFGNAREKEKRVKAFEAAWARLQFDEPGFALEEIDQLFERNLVSWLVIHKAMLIGEIIPVTLSYLRENPLCPERNLFDHVLVDEYQDLNKAEQVLVRLLAGNGTLTIIGDDDQSIYSFKHAHPEGIREFPNEHDNCESITFNECRRCPALVVQMASTLINNNHNRTLGNLAPTNGNDQGNVHVLQWNTLDEEVWGLSELVTHYLNNDNIQPGDILILTPRRRIGYRIRDLLLQAGIEVRSYFREQALDSKEARRAYSLLNLAAVPNDRVSLRYLLGVGSQDYRQPAYRRLLNKAQEIDCSVRDVLDRIIAGELRIRNTNHIINVYRQIIDDISSLNEQMNEDAMGIVNYLAPEGNDNFAGLREALEAAIETIGAPLPDEDLSNWLLHIFQETRENISMPNVPEEVNHVRIMSLHASKGLGAKMVIICGCIEGLIPRDDPELTDGERQQLIEEQRRLFYVAITRCKNESGIYPGTLILSSCVEIPGVEAVRLRIPARHDQNRRVVASRFLRELGPQRPRAEVGRDYLLRLRER
ncbi:ATP-dependent helicase [Pelotomaculum propionicicum]|uniref:DNA 3'-5' helicase n=1 Tax=Pelotomaculum propionicicum TaxID=258475 RepID=A0A4Y7RK25_9FIRM|nr:ATP-dependent helicase [Pelotomaculum propionicicum]TEB09089.1 ATP-dependent DNA helicase PcrA [Pelotomaculum propionicicum]